MDGADIGAVGAAMRDNACAPAARAAAQLLATASAGDAAHLWDDRLLYLLTLTTSWRCSSGESASATTVVTLLDIMDFVSDGQYLSSQ